MRLLLRRSVGTHQFMPWRIEYALWARFEITDSERMLIRKYNLEGTYLTIEGSWRDYRKALLIAIVPTVLITLFVGSSPQFSFIFIILFSTVSYLALTWLIYEQLRDAIKILDILNDRDFKSRSAILHIRRERVTLGYAVAFKNLITVMQ